MRRADDCSTGSQAHTAPAELYDGQVPVPLNGELRVYRNLLVFHPSPSQAPPHDAVPKQLEFSAAQILGVSTLGGQLHIELASTDDPELSLKLITDPALQGAVSLERDWQPIGVVAALAQRISRAGLAVKILVVLAAVPPAAFLIFRGFSAAYLLIPLEADRRLGERLEAAFAGRFESCVDPRLNDELTRTARMLRLPEDRFDYRVRVVRDKRSNAFAAPGGLILIFSGLLESAESQGEVLGVLAHEISHIERRHSMQHITKLLGLYYVSSMIIGAGFEELEAAETIAEIANTLIFFRYSKESERQADTDAVKRLAAHSLSAAGLRDFFSRLKKEEDRLLSLPEAKSKEGAGQDNTRAKQAAQQILDWLSTHPATAERIAYLTRLIDNYDRGLPPEKRLPLPDVQWDQMKRACARSE